MSNSQHLIQTRSPHRTVPGPVLLPVVLAALAAVVVAGPVAAVESRTFTESFPADRAVRLANLAGTVDLLPGSGDRVRVEATVYAEGDSAAETRRLLDGMGWRESRHVLGEAGWALSYPIDDYRGFAYPGSGRGIGTTLFGWLSSSRSTIRYEGERVRVVGRRSGSFPILYADLKVTMPAGAELVIRNGVGTVEGGDLDGDLVVDTGSGDVRLASFSGDLLVDTGSGDVDLGPVDGSLSVDTGSGDVDVQRLGGEATVDTGSGHIRLRDVDSDRLHLDTGSGDIEVLGGRAGNAVADTGSGDIRFEGVEVVRFEGDTGSGDVDLMGSLARAEKVVIDTGSGDVTIYGGPSASFELTTDLGSGDLTVRYDDAELRREDRELVGARRGDGRTRIHVDTGSGDCVISPGR